MVWFLPFQEILKGYNNISVCFCLCLSNLDDTKTVRFAVASEQKPEVMCWNDMHDHVSSCIWHCVRHAIDRKHRKKFLHTHTNRRKTIEMCSVLTLQVHITDSRTDWKRWHPSISRSLRAITSFTLVLWRLDWWSKLLWGSSDEWLTWQTYSFEQWTNKHSTNFCKI